MEYSTLALATILGCRFICGEGSTYIILCKLTKIFGVIHVGIGNLELHSGVNLTPIRKMCCIISSLSLADLASIF